LQGSTGDVCNILPKFWLFKGLFQLFELLGQAFAGTSTAAYDVTVPVADIADFVCDNPTSSTILGSNRV